MIKETDNIKIIKTDDFNLIFNKKTGVTLTWGKKPEDDPDYSPVGPIIADIEISTICDQGCSFCYKGNTSKGINMSFETFQNIFHKLPRSLNQIAFGIGNIAANPDLKKIFDYCKNNDYQYIVPNVTINGFNMTKEWYDYLAATCGAIAVSYYNDDNCFNSIKEFTDRGLKQCNIHCLLSRETFENCLTLVDKAVTDKRLLNLGAIVFLRYKPKGRNKGNFNQVNEEQFKQLMEKCEKLGIKVGMDSCSSKLYMDYIIKNKNEEDIVKYSQYVESCESCGIMSSYINAEGKYFPCSFSEGEGEWLNGIDVVSCSSFLEDVWFSDLLNKYRNKTIKEAIKYPNTVCRKCFVYEDLNN